MVDAFLPRRDSVPRRRIDDVPFGEDNGLGYARWHWLALGPLHLRQTRQLRKSGASLVTSASQSHWKGYFFIETLFLTILTCKTLLGLQALLRLVFLPRVPRLRRYRLSLAMARQMRGTSSSKVRGGVAPSRTAATTGEAARRRAAMRAAAMIIQMRRASMCMMALTSACKVRTARRFLASRH